MTARKSESTPANEHGRGWDMTVIAVIQDPAEIRDILAHLVKTGRAPTGFDPALLN